MNIQSNFSLDSFNTLAFPSVAEQYCEATTEQELESALAYAASEGLDVHILGGGSNVLMAPSVSGLVIRPTMRARSFSKHGKDVLVLLGAGEVWHDVVEWTVDQGWSGIESMALIPGAVGAAPVQNIGAYGTELKDVIVCVRAYDRQNQEWLDLLVHECKFGYRDSFFKRNPGRYVITEVTLKLSIKQRKNVRYAALQSYFDQLHITEPSVRQIFEGVCAVRRSKLPDPKELGNAGSFFKNPVISAVQYAQLIEEWPKLVAYAEPDGRYKVAAGWLIDQCEWKGCRQGEVGVYSKQALVLVHFGGGTRSQLLNLANEIKESVNRNFGIELEIEPQLFPL